VNKDNNRELPDLNFDSDGNITLIFPEELCKAFFGTNSYDSVGVLENAEWLPSQDVFINDGNDLAVVLNEANVVEWTAYSESLIQEAFDDAIRLNAFELSADEKYTGLTIEANSESSSSVANILMKAVPCFYILQVLNGVEPKDVHLELLFLNIDTGKTVWHGVLPHETFKISSEDWNV
jgi:hypothetical protein